MNPEIRALKEGLDEQRQVIVCVALRVLADLKVCWPHLRSGSHDEDMIYEALVEAEATILPRFLPKTYRRDLATFAYKGVHGALLRYAETTASQWHSGRETRPDLLETFRAPLDIYEHDLIDESSVDHERCEWRSRVAAEIAELAGKEEDLGIVLELAAHGVSCGELGAELGVHHNVVAHRRDRALERLQYSEGLRDLYAERFGGDALEIEYGHRSPVLVEPPRFHVSWHQFSPALTGCRTTRARRADSSRHCPNIPGLAPSRVGIGAFHCRRASAQRGFIPLARPERHRCLLPRAGPPPVGPGYACPKPSLATWATGTLSRWGPARAAPS